MSTQVGGLLSKRLGTVGCQLSLSTFYSHYATRINFYDIKWTFIVGHEVYILTFTVVNWLVAELRSKDIKLPNERICKQYSPKSIQKV